MTQLDPKALEAAVDAFYGDHPLPSRAWDMRISSGVERAIATYINSPEVLAHVAKDPRVQAMVLRGQWQPIETAPKDGTAVLLWCPNFYFGGGVWLGWWTGSYFDVCTEGSSDAPYSDDGATHWMPVPGYSPAHLGNPEQEGR